MTNKQTQTQQPVDEWELNVDFLKRIFLKPFELQRQPILEAREIMRENGVSDKLIDQVTHYDEDSQERHYKEVIRVCTNNKTQQLWDLPTLSNAGMVSNSEIDSIIAKHNGKSPPYYTVNQIHRILDDRVNPPKEYLTCHILFEGFCVGKRSVNIINPEPHRRINMSTFVGYHTLTPIEWHDMVDNYDKGSSGEEKKVGVFNDRHWYSGESGSRIYDIPWSIETFQKMMEHTNNGKAGLSVIQLSTHKHYGIPSVSEFCTDDLPGLVKRLGEPQPTYKFDIDPKALAEFMKFQKAKEAEGEAHFQ